MTIETILIACCPALVSIVGAIIAYIKMKLNNAATNSQICKEITAIRVKIEDTAEYEALMNQLKIQQAENRELKNKYCELLTKIDRISRPQEE